MNFDINGIYEYDEMVNKLMDRGSYTYEPKKLDFDLKNKAAQQTQPSIKEPLALEFKASRTHAFRFL